VTIRLQDQHAVSRKAALLLLHNASFNGRFVPLMLECDCLRTLFHALSQFKRSTAELQKQLEAKETNDTEYQALEKKLKAIYTDMKIALEIIKNILAGGQRDHQTADVGAASLETAARQMQVTAAAAAALELHSGDKQLDKLAEEVSWSLRITGLRCNLNDDALSRKIRVSPTWRVKQRNCIPASKE
jgi:hypothetical protein